MHYEIAIGLPSYNEAERIGFVTEQVDKGISKFFDARKAVIVNLDSRSPDKTKEVFLNVPTKTKKMVLDVPRGKGSALVKFWLFSKSHSIPLIATIDADLLSITKDWVEYLLRPLANNTADVVLPLYARNRYGGNITNHFAYPIFKSVLKAEVRQPLAGEFGYSESFYKYLLTQKKVKPTYQYGIDIFISSHAVAGGFRISHPDLGKKIDKPSFYHQEKTFLEVSESAFFTIREIISNKTFNKEIEGTKAGFCAIDDFESFPHKKNIPETITRLKKQFKKNERVAKKYLGTKITELVADKIYYDQLNMSDQLWTDVLLEAIKLFLNPCFAYPRIRKLAQLLLPIYRWRVISFWLSVEKKPAFLVEKMVRRQAFLLKSKVEKYEY